MRCVFVLFDTLNRRSLGCYGGTTVKTPNFDRFARAAIAFDNHYVGSLPCMPARREIMTGRYNFLHRSWGPVEPFDNAFPELLGTGAGTYVHLVSDHAHYWQDGGATYHTRYDSAELIRGQEKDSWKGIVNPPASWAEEYHPSQYSSSRRHRYRRNITNRQFYKDYEDYPAVQTFTTGLEFLKLNKDADNWFLQIETFDPHEPFQVPPSFREDYPTEYRGPILDWPVYGPAKQTADEADELRANYAATLAHCDLQLGRLLDYFDEHDLWKDTALVLATDHGFLLGEQEMWGKLVMPVYNEVAHIPLLVYHPKHVRQGGQRRTALTQTIDLMPTFLDMFGVGLPADVMGKSLMPLLSEDDKNFRQAALYGQHGAAINITDGRYTYFRYPDDVRGGKLNQYTLMPTHIESLFSVEELRGAELAPPFSFTKGVPVLKVASTPLSPVYHRQGAGIQIDTESRLFDLQSDPRQLKRINDRTVEERLVDEMTRIMDETDCPKELYERFDLPNLKLS
ncbi:sulfatase [Telluria sp. Tellsp104]